MDRTIALTFADVPARALPTHLKYCAHSYISEEVYTHCYSFILSVSLPTSSGAVRMAKICRVT